MAVTSLLGCDENVLELGSGGLRHNFADILKKLNLRVNFMIGELYLKKAVMF